VEYIKVYNIIFGNVGLET